MPAKKRSRGNAIPLIVQDHPEEYTGYPFVSVIQHRNQHVLSIIDNADDKIIQAFVLDFCGPEEVDEWMVINVTSTWFYTHKHRYPLSFEFSRLNLTNQVSKIYRTYNVEFVTRVIGPLPHYEMEEIYSVKRRRRKAVPTGVEIRQKVVKIV